MSKSKNIEDIFRDAFEGHIEKPSPKVWSKVDGNIRAQRINFFIKHSFNNFKFIPSAHVWSRINAALWLPRFLKFNLAQFNIYYAVVGLLVIAASTVAISNIGENIKDIGLPVLAKNEFVERAYKKATVKLNDEGIDNNIGTDVALNIEQTTNSNEILYSQAEELIPENTNVDNQSTQDIRQYNNLENEGLDETINNSNSSEQITDNNEIVSLTNIEVESNNETDVNIDINALDTFELSWWMPRINAEMYKLPYIPSTHKYLNPSPSLLTNRDEIVPDTIAYDTYGDPIVVYNDCISLEPYFGVSYASPVYSALNSENALIANAYQDGITPLLSYHYGLNVNIRSNHLSISSGLAYTILNEELSISTIEETITQNFIFEHFENEQIDYDTTYVLDLDAWLLGDTVYVELIDSTTYTFIDSVEVALNDTSFTTISNSYQNSSSYFEIPLMIGYSFGGKNFSITPSVGLITGFLSGASGTFISASSGNPSEITALKPYNKLLFSVQGSIKLRYYFEQNFGLMVEPWYRHKLVNLYQENSGVSKRDMRYGVNLGITYRF